jgi:hypothetical protein
MNSSNGHDSTTPGAVQPKDEPAAEVSAPPSPGIPQVFATSAKQRPRQQLSENKPLVISAGAVIFALLLFVLISSPKHKNAKSNAPRPAALAGAQGVENPDSQKSLFPVTDSGRPASKDPHDGLLNEQDVQRTATRQPAQANAAGAAKASQGGTLGSLPPFDPQGQWQAPPYQPNTGSSDSNNDLIKAEKGTDQPSLVFVRKVTQTDGNHTPALGNIDSEPTLGLATGTRLRARLEAAASTAVRTPVIAVVEYNYERNGEIIVPAGAKAFGHIEQADRSGYLSIRFDTLMMPDGASTAIEAVATDIGLRPLKGRVEGRNTGKNAVIRSLSGIGQVGALLAGRSGSLNQPFSEGDLVRERFSTNIGETADQEVTRLSVSEHVVVSISANTPIYVVLDHGTKNGLVAHAAQMPATPAAPSQSLESVRQLLQLQRELNQTADVGPRQ